MGKSISHMQESGREGTSQLEGRNMVVWDNWTSLRRRQLMVGLESRDQGCHPEERQQTSKAEECGRETGSALRGHELHVVSSDPWPHRAGLKWSHWIIFNIPAGSIWRLAFKDLASEETALVIWKILFNTASNVLTSAILLTALVFPLCESELLQTQTWHPPPTFH